MRVPVLTQRARFLTRSVAVLAIAGAAAGCSSGSMRFQDGIFTSSTSNARAADQYAVQQPQTYTPPQTYPGGVDTTYTGSINRQAVQPVRVASASPRKPGVPIPAVDVGGRMAAPQPLPQPVSAASQPYPGDVARGSVVRQPAPAITSAALPPAGVDRTVTGSVAPQTRQAPGAGNWTRSGGSLVTVKQGDTLYGLSLRHGVPVEAIVEANGLKSADSVRIGQQLVIPARGAPVQAATKQTNNVQTANADGPAGQLPAPADPGQHVAVLPQGQRLNERKSGAEAARPAVKAEAPGAAPTTGAVYTVVSGDTLAGIAKRLGTTTAALKQANGLDSALIRVGQKLVVPGADATPQTVAATKMPTGVDPIVTGSTKAGKANEDKRAAEVGSYTPPRKDDKAIEEAVEQAAAAPDATGIGRMRWPVRGRVVVGFGQSLNGKPNDGLDIAVPEGTPIKAAENGVVIYAGDGLKDFGKTVLVRHEDGLVTVYGHASEIEVERGDTVRRGQQIAKSGLTGNAESPKLHFEVRKNATPVDPTKYLE